MKKTMVVAVVALAAMLSPVIAAPAPAHAAALTGADFIKASGNVLKTESGTGATVNLRGTNVGGWLTQEDWMSPLGEFAVDRSGWTLTGSGGSPANAVDGSAATRWTTGANQAGSEWIRLDLSAATLFNRLSIDNSNNAGQYPRSLNVETSSDGVTWKSVATRPGTDGVTTAQFTPQVARYVRVSQTGTAAALWSVGEINLFNDPVLFNGTHTATASSSAPGTSPGSAIDGNIGTVWQSGVPQVPGQSYTIDLGRNVDMDKVLFDSGAATAGDYPRVWDVYTSYDNANFTHVASGYGTNRVIQADFQGAKGGRYLRIASNGTSSQWWSIAEIAITSGGNLDRGGWAVTATTGSGPANIIDNSVSSRWTTGAAQANGQTLTVDMGALITLNNVTTDTAKNSTDEQDYPRGYSLQLSKNGTAWTTVATGAGTRKATTIHFPAQSARYFRLVQTGTAAQWWSIGELTAGLYNDDYSLNTTLTSRFGASGAQSVIDAHQDTWLTAADLDNIAATGMNFIRVPIGWNTFLNVDGSWKADPWEKIDWIISEASARGMYVLVDLHTVPGGGCPWGSCGRIGPNPNGFWGSATYQNWTEDIWEAIATRYEGNPGVAGYDLINEPLIDYGEDADDVAQKSDYYDRLYDAVRAIDPDHTIFLGAFFGLGAIAAPSTYGWTNVVYEYHPYDMPNSKDWTAQNQLVTNELAGLPAKLADPGIPILYGEYSLYYNDDVWSRFMAGLNASHVSWSAWTYKVKGSANDGFAYWGMYYNNPRPVPIINSDNAATFISKVSQFGTANFTKNDRFVATLTKYAAGATSFAPTAVSHSGWTATASSTAPGTSTAGGIDGVGSGAWSSGAAMAGGEWYRIDMGANRTVAMVTVQTPSGSTWDYPRGFTVETSTDGTTWSMAATGIAYGWKRPISISPTTARYIRITQTGAAPQWWTIDEVSVYSSY
ncbi:discoidin domain-containing protein [Microbacterium sp. cx-55]|uniref:discoidin domain-containing protein n=1 Tax=Microbacterium sp. cx-55 TaxID=2875948 RepID=UPI001CBB799B|nr:discoidin domain-containing protein [Microbacterium sp. cx-55]MBZ4487111.1 discoidin domain-containing protein [Microbacterium sp. cx-55]UGB35147.1 discoidin domain-containing protein [Microbacterium sp. cx-55]